ncbi:MAG: glycosyltransferase family 2 protein [Leptospiraceae bacterium]|nr:glycosyltransferase family 2 protein [Leptospiraceae bacterium]
MSSTLGIIVTFNRLSLLKNCLSAVQNQTQKPDEVLVINNGSTDGTAEFLDSLDWITVIHKINDGGAGGFYAGIEYGLKSKHDFFWCMDDDGFPKEDALEKLLKHTSKDYAALNSLVVSLEDSSVLSFGMPELDKNRMPKLKKPFTIVEELKKISIDGETVPFGSFFNGTLLYKNVVEKVGNIKKELFIWGDELDYIYRLQKEKEVRTVLDSIHFHPKPIAKNPPIWKLYFGLRNSIYNTRLHLNHKILRFLKTLITLFPKFLAQKNGMKFFLKAMINGFKNDPSPKLPFEV